MVSEDLGWLVSLRKENISIDYLCYTVVKTSIVKPEGLCYRPSLMNYSLQHARLGEHCN